MTELVIDTPRVLLPALKPARYIGLYGGRGGAKSHFFAEKLIERCMVQKTRWACIREVQSSIRESVRQLLVDKIEKFGVQDQFEVLEAEIRCPHGGLIVFKGMQSYNAANLKSLEDYDGAWVEEAQTLSEVSLRLLRPTIRKEGSELWFSWNPRHSTDAVDKFFRGGERPANSILIKVNWSDNPWFPKVLRAEMEDDYRRDPEMAEHVWGGGYESITEASYYARHIVALEKAGRIGEYPHMEGRPVYTGWDLGISDYTAVWFVQQHYDDDMQPRVRIIDYFEASGYGLQDVFAEALPEYTIDKGQQMHALLALDRPQPYTYAKHYMPHDIGVRELGAGGKSRIETLIAMGVPAPHLARGVANGPEERINAVRELLPDAEFNATPRVMHGIERLRRYSRRFNRALNTYSGVLHDEASHGSDALGEFAVNYRNNRWVEPARQGPDFRRATIAGIVPPPPPVARRSGLVI